MLLFVFPHHLLWDQLFSNQESRPHPRCFKQGVCYRGVEGLEEQNEERRVCVEEQGGEGGRYPKMRKLPLGWSPGVCTRGQLPACCCSWPGTRSQHSAGGCCGLLSSPDARCCRRQTRRGQKVCPSSCHPVSSLWQDLTGSQLAKDSGKCSLQAFSSGDTERSIEVQVWPKECSLCLGMMNLS